MLSAIAFQAALCFLEPSLKSILSLTTAPGDSGRGPGSSSSQLGLGMGLMRMATSAIIDGSACKSSLLINIRGQMIVEFPVPED